MLCDPTETKRRSPRYRVEETLYGCVLTLTRDYSYKDVPTTHEFWCHSGSGYVFETTHNPGTSGRQVCETLFGVGSTMMTRPRYLTDRIRSLARAHCNLIDFIWTP